MDWKDCRLLKARNVSVIRLRCDLCFRKIYMDIMLLDLYSAVYECIHYNVHFKLKVKTTSLVLREIGEQSVNHCYEWMV